MDPYGRLYYYLIRAHNAKGFVKHGFSQKGADFLKSMEQGKKSLPFDRDPENVRSAIMRNLLNEETSLTLAVFLMLINPEAYEPRKEKAFSFWQWPKTQYELDHQGQFMEMNNDMYVYSGAETKLSYTSIYPYQGFANCDSGSLCASTTRRTGEDPGRCDESWVRKTHHVQPSYIRTNTR